MGTSSRQPSNTSFSSQDLTVVEESMHFIKATNGLLQPELRDIGINGGEQPKRLNNSQIRIKELLTSKAVFVFDHT